MRKSIQNQFRKWESIRQLAPGPMPPLSSLAFSPILLRTILHYLKLSMADLRSCLAAAFPEQPSMVLKHTVQG